ncbi:ArsC/Spx/MgsR family protein [Sciscionella marina]|uniref:ArsC/Spx/MgsR family protein n=1 Tax=Sciscionella marina TaxID=508770 RepID=UPI000362920A|nr:ArsC/Spx/MgsR family protein [Sciscionella marina]
MEIWINPECSKCASALEQLDVAGGDYTVRHYLEPRPTTTELAAALDRLGLEPWDIARTAEAVAGELGLEQWNRTPAERDRWLEALAAHPILIQRPIITADDGRTVLGRSAAVQRTLGQHTRG